MATNFAKLMKEIRKPEGESLRTMAKRLDISAAFLSALEVGKKTIPLDYPEKICKEYNLDNDMYNRLVDAVSESNNMIKLGLDDLNAEQKDVSLLFARKIVNADPDLIKKLKEALEDDKD